MAILGDTTTTKLTTDMLVAKEIKVSNQSDVNITLLNAIYPIGSIYVFCIQDQAIPDTCPIADTLGGTWVKIEDRFLYSTTDANKYGQIKGSNKAYIVNHYHKLDSSVTTTVTENNWTEFAGSHWHRLTINSPGSMDSNRYYEAWPPQARHTLNTSSDAQNTNYVYRGYLNDNEDISGKEILIEKNGTHRHIIPALKVSGSTQEPLHPGINENLDDVYSNSTAKEANMPAYLGVIAWRRTA